MQHPTPRILALLLVVAVGSAAQAKDLHVDNVAGDDLWNGQAAVRADNDGPTKTIAKALRMAGPGDRIVLTKTAAPYQESVSLVGSRHSGTPTRPFVFEGNGAILSGLAPVPDEVWEPFQGDIFRFRTQRPHDQQVYWQGKPLRRVLDPAQIERRELAPLEWLIDEGHVFFRVEPERLPSSYQLEASWHSVGLTLYKVHNVVLSNLVIQGFQIDGVNLSDADGPCLLAGVTSRGNGRSGVAVCGATQVVLDDCLLGDNGRTQLLVDGPSTARTNGSRILGNTAPQWTIRAGGKLFVDGAAQSTASDPPEAGSSR